MSQSEVSIITNPYRPAVREIAPDDPPFVVQSGEELPAGQG
jgi:hypothetical protein